MSLVSSISYLRGWNRALLSFESGLHCKESSHSVAMKYNNLPGVVSVYRDEYQSCRLTYRILLKFDGRYMTPRSLHFYQDWSSLNYMYGVVNVSFHEDMKLIAHLEFEPGLYTNHQMKVKMVQSPQPSQCYLYLPGHTERISEAGGDHVRVGGGDLPQ